MLSCAFASAMLINAGFLSQNTVAASSEAAGIQTIQRQPRFRLAQNEGAAAVTDPYVALEALIKEDEARRAKAKASKGEEAPIPAVDEQTLSLYPTAAKCGECHKQIYEEWSSSQHAYASISPMFHKFEQKFQELTQGTVGTFCVRCHQQVGTQLGEGPDRARGRELHHLPPGQGGVRQGQRRAPCRAGQDLRAGLRQRRKERDQRRARQQGNLLRQNQH